MEILADLFHQAWEFLRHPGEVLKAFVSQYGTLVYLLLFGVVFAETGLVVMPFLPGDSLLFAVGALAADPTSGMSVPLLYPLFIGAALLGDNVNYWIGRKLGRKLFTSETSKVFNKKHLHHTEAFFAKYGVRAIILARFVPFVRTFAPFVAGMGSMSYPRFLAFSVAGALFWVGLCVTAGVLLGNLPVVKKNFELVVLAIVFISILPPIIEFMKHRQEKQKERAAASTGQPAAE